MFACTSSARDPWLALLPRISERVVGEKRALPPLIARSRPQSATAALAVGSTVAIIKLSEQLFVTLEPAAGVALLSLACLLQWALLDGAWASLALALIVAIGGPLAEIPFLVSGCWHYLSPDYFPLAGLLADDSATATGLNYITGPCYFAVTTDAIALGRWLAGPASKEPE